ncbi:MAG: hypothetical protein DWQ37_10675 [Planctomycetota bacterium]|nr:MAG: hypothetical protein DWQ37_10675 [Planctomycetota bacterium]
MKLRRGHFGGGQSNLWPLYLLTALLLVGCGSKNQETASPPAVDEEFWEAYYLQGAKIGYGRTTLKSRQRDDGSVVFDVDSLNHLTVKRFGTTTENDIEMQTVETPEGRLLSFRTEVAMGPSPTISTGKVEGGEIVITTETGGRSDTARLPWSRDVRGFRGIEQTLAEEPLEPGEKRTIKMLMPLVNQIAEVDLTARDVEKTSVLGVDAELLRVDSVARLPGGQSIETILWIDEDGEVIKNRVAALDQESYRTTRELALAPGGNQQQFDLGLDLIVPVDPPLENPHASQKVRYRVELKDSDPSEALASGSTQKVDATGPHAAEVTVFAARGGKLAQPGEPAAKPGDEFTAPNGVLQADDARIREMAREARGEAIDPTEVALALERYVNKVVSEKNFSHGFATAADVAETRSGDCTEHAVLLAALLRACGIPSRVAIGLVYVERAGGFGYHMWTEAYLGGHWVPLDGIRGQGGTSAAYLKLTDSSLAGTSAYSSFLAVARVLGQLKVEVVEAN